MRERALVTAIPQAIVTSAAQAAEPLKELGCSSAQASIWYDAFPLLQSRCHSVGFEGFRAISWVCTRHNVCSPLIFKGLDPLAMGRPTGPTETGRANPL